ncbi:anti-sigma factor [Micromonospora arborensis]|uniref:anti-sigma factor n=1 Tax=Micromonospora arborensis TaxID=2116518 RepID=UPI003F4D45FB
MPEGTPRNGRGGFPHPGACRRPRSDGHRGDDDVVAVLAGPGDARVLQNHQLHLHAANLPRVPGYYEVWLINPTTMKMLSVGTLGGGPDALLPLPPNVDLQSYSVVDVSAEQYDNKPAHSGDSLLRGTLTG